MLVCREAPINQHNTHTHTERRKPRARTHTTTHHCAHTRDTNIYIYLSKQRHTTHTHTHTQREREREKRPLSFCSLPYFSSRLDTRESNLACAFGFLFRINCLRVSSSFLELVLSPNFLANSSASLASFLSFLSLFLFFFTSSSLSKSEDRIQKDNRFNCSSFEGITCL